MRVPAGVVSMMHNDKAQKELREWFTELRDAKKEMAEIDAIADPEERAMRRRFLGHRIERIEMNIDRIMGRL